MESAVVLRPFNGAPQSVTNASRRCFYFQVSKSSTKPSLLPCAKAATTASSLTPDGIPLQGLSPGRNVPKSTFPNGFEALVLKVCDETEVAELKLKVGEFEMCLKRDTGSQTASTLVAQSAVPPPVPSQPKVESSSAAPQGTPRKSIPASTTPFANISSAKASKLATLEASGSNAYVLVSAPTVGLFRSGRTLKGKKQPPSCKEGDMIKEGQVIGFLDQFGSELPVKSDSAGEVLKILFKDGEPVGYGDPLVAVLPFFHGIR